MNSRTPTAPAQVTARVIGHVRCQVPDADVGRRRRHLIVDIQLLPPYVPALDGLADYSHVFVLFWMHKVERARWAPRAHPRGDPELPEVGVLASRGRNHPNPIGLAVGELLGVHEDRLRVARVDAFDGTPVLDIKPYDPYDVVPDPRVPDWWGPRQRP